MAPPNSEPPSSRKHRRYTPPILLLSLIAKNNYLKNRVNATGSGPVVASEDGEFADLDLPDTALAGKTHRSAFSGQPEISRRYPVFFLTLHGRYHRMANL
jgi:hypothetical protein